MPILNLQPAKKFLHQNYGKIAITSGILLVAGVAYKVSHYKSNPPESHSFPSGSDSFVNPGSSTHSSRDVKLPRQDLTDDEFLKGINRVNINRLWVDGLSPLMLACQDQRAALVPSLIKLNAKVELKDKKGRTALFYAIESGNIETVNALLENKAKVNIADEEGKTPLMIAINTADDESITLPRARKAKKLKMVTALVSAGAELNALDLYQMSALTESASGGEGEVLNYLISQGGNKHIRDHEGWTLLMYASYNGRVEIIDALIGKHESAVNEQDFFGNTALIHAIKGLKIHAFEALIKNGAYTDLPSNDSMSPLMHACMIAKPCYAEALIKKGAEITYTDHLGRTALMLACAAGCLETVKLFAPYLSTVIDMQDNNGHIALDYAQDNERQDIIEYLLGKK